MAKQLQPRPRFRTFTGDLAANRREVEKRVAAAPAAAVAGPDAAMGSRLAVLRQLVAAAVPKLFPIQNVPVTPGSETTRFGPPQHRPITDADLLAHIDGSGGRLAIYLVPPDDQPNAGMTQLLVVDVDDHGPGGEPEGEDHTDWASAAVISVATRAAEALRAAGAVVHAVQSAGQKGLHLCVVFDHWVLAQAALAWARAAIESAGLTIGSGGALSEQVELFPKQDRVAVGKFGNNIGLPFRAGAASLRADLSPLGPDAVVPAWQTTLASVVPQPAGGTGTGGAMRKLSSREAARANAVFEIAHNYGYDGPKLRSALHWLADRGDVDSPPRAPIGLVGRKAWSNTTLACGHEAARFPEHEEEIWEMHDAASWLAAERHRATYDPVVNRQQFDDAVARGHAAIKDGYGVCITIATIYKAAQDESWEWSSAPGEVPVEAENGGAAGEVEAPAPLALPQQLTEWNAKHFAILHGGKTRIGNLHTLRETGDLKFAAPFQMRQIYANVQAWKPVQLDGGDTGRKLVAAWSEWMTWAARRTYTSMDMIATGQPVPDGTLNMWFGFRRELAWQGAGGGTNREEYLRAMEACPTILDFIRECICGGAAEDQKAAFKHLIQLLAWKAQHPLDLPGIAIVLRGGEGAGKTTFGKLLMKMFHPYGATISQPKHVTGAFNGQLENRLIVIVEEAIWAGDHVAEGVLKDMITGETINIERKGLDLYTVTNRALQLLFSNNTWVVPAGARARRYLVIDASDARCGDRAYWNDMYERKMAQELPAFLHMLQHMSLAVFDRFAVPQTRALREQKSLSGDLSEQFWRAVLRHSGLPRVPRYNSLRLPEAHGSELVYQEWKREVPCPQFQASFTEYCASVGNRKVVHPSAFMKKIHQMSMQRGARLIKDKQPGGVGKRVRSYTLGTLDEHRRAAAAYLRITIAQLLDED